MSEQRDHILDNIDRARIDIDRARCDMLDVWTDTYGKRDRILARHISTFYDILAATTGCPGHTTTVSCSLKDVLDSVEEAHSEIMSIKD